MKVWALLREQTGDIDCPMVETQVVSIHETEIGALTALAPLEALADATDDRDVSFCVESFELEP